MIRAAAVAILVLIAAYGGFETGQHTQFAQDRKQAVAGMCGRYNAASGAFEWIVPTKDKSRQKQAAQEASENAVRVAGR